MATLLSTILMVAPLAISIGAGYLALQATLEMLRRAVLKTQAEPVADNVIAFIPRDPEASFEPMRIAA